MGNRRRILFIAEGITMAHFTRAAVLAHSLDPAHWDVYFFTPERYHRFLNDKIRNKGQLETLDPKAFLRSLSRGTLLYTADTIRSYVRDELELFDRIKPDIVIGDYRLSLCVSAPTAHIPFVSLYNAYWSPHFNQLPNVPQYAFTRMVPLAILNRIYGMVRPIAYRYHARQVNVVRREYDLPTIRGDIRHLLTTGDITLYPDIPELLPLAHLPANHHFIGPCDWEVEIEKPDWWDDIMRSQTKKIFVALGSSGPLPVLPEILRALSHLPLTGLVATSGRITLDHPGCYVADFLPYTATIRNCEVLVSNGGSTSIYSALAAGIPVLAIPSNIDTQLSSQILENSKAGIVLRAEHASATNILRTLRQLIDDAQFKDSATRWSNIISKYDTPKLFSDILRHWFDGRQLSPLG
jgi:UDP:flavonoid glycosyltransferase YjiC (YdhE family)